MNFSFLKSICLIMNISIGSKKIDFGQKIIGTKKFGDTTVGYYSTVGVIDTG